MIMLLLFLISFLGGVITLIFSFGLNVILIPVLSLFIPINLAIAFSGVTFLFYNTLRLFLTWRFISWKIVLQFTPLAFSGVVIGGILLNYVTLFFTPKELKIFMGILLLTLVLLDLFKITQRIKLKDTTFLLAGIFISGLAGGLTGFQGPFRVASLTHLKLDYQTFLATSTMVGFIIDGTRTIIYFFTFLHLSQLLSPILLVTTLGSVLGFLLFFKLTNKIKMEKFKPLILVFIIILVSIMIFI